MPHTREGLPHLCVPLPKDVLFISGENAQFYALSDSSKLKMLN
jgi:hypothetical protein